MKIWNVPAAGGRLDLRPIQRSKKNVLFREGEGGARNIRPLLRTRRLLEEISQLLLLQLQNSSCYDNDVVDLWSNYAHDEMGI